MNVLLVSEPPGFADAPGFADGPWGRNRFTERRDEDQMSQGSEQVGPLTQKFCFLFGKMSQIYMATVSTGQPHRLG